MNKILIAIFITHLISANAMADNHKKKKDKDNESAKYNKSKTRCLNSNPNLFGKALQKCISGKTKK